MSRANDIRLKIEYSDHCFQSLMNDIMEAGMAGKDVNYFQQRSIDMLSTLREVFDYAARDIFEIHVRNQLSPEKAAKANSYFPFYKSQTVPKAWFSYVKATCPPLYDYVVAMIERIESKECHPNTNILSDRLLNLSDTNNRKKHDSLPELTVKERVGRFARNENGDTIMIDVTAGNNSEVTLFPGQKSTIMSGKQIYFAENGQDVAKFIMECRTITKFIIKDIYQWLPA